MSVCGQTEEDSVSDDPVAAGAPVREMYEQKAVSKVVRVLTVLAYLLSVSLAAILLSVYYVCVWQSPKLPPLNDTDDGHISALRADPPHFDNHTNYFNNHTNHSFNETRGGNSTVSEGVPTSTSSDELTSLPTEPSDPSTLSDVLPSATLPTEDPNVTWVTRITNNTDQR